MVSTYKAYSFILGIFFYNLFRLYDVRMIIVSLVLSKQWLFKNSMTIVINTNVVGS
jgi:hypothetical protein